jgi:hypothetical protein
LKGFLNKNNDYWDAESESGFHVGSGEEEREGNRADGKENRVHHQGYR